MIIIAKNVTQSDIPLSDLYSISIPASSQLTLSNSYPFVVIERSDELKTAVTNEDVVINDGTTDLNATNGLQHLTYCTEWEIKNFAPKIHNLDYHGDVPAYPSSAKWIMEASNADIYWIETPDTSIAESWAEKAESIALGAESQALLDNSIADRALSLASLSNINGFFIAETSSDIESSTTSLIYQQKLRLTTSSLPSGKYRIGWHFEWRISNSTKDFKATVQINDTTTAMEYIQQSGDSGADQFEGSCGFYYYTGSGVLNIDLDFASSSSSHTASIRRARLDIWRVA